MSTTVLAAFMDLVVANGGLTMGHVFGNAALEANSASRKLRAALQLRQAQAKAQARRNMGGWRLVDTRLRGQAV